MREIKFSYIQQHSETGIFSESILTIEQIEGLQSGIVYKGYTLVARRQFTGLRDKNGVEVYEGDVIECEYYGGLPTTVNLESLIWRGVVVWRGDASFSILRIGTDNGWYSVRYGGSAVKRWEVIGNIYEHPSLLEAK